MKSSIITTFLLLGCAIAFGQTKIENKLTPKHQNIAGTKISLVPPVGWIPGTNFFGFQQPETSSNILILDIPGPYSETSKAMNKTDLSNKGLDVGKIKQFKLNGLPAIFVAAKQNSNGRIYAKYLLVFGTESETIIINGAFPEQFKKIGTEIKKSMMTAFYESDKTINPFEALDFTIDVSATKLQFAKSMAGSLMYSVDGNVPTLSNDKTFFIATKSFSKVEVDDKRQFSINRLKQLSIDIAHIEYTNEITIDGTAGYEIYAKGKSEKTGEIQNVYQVILFSEGLYYIFVGLTNDETEASLNELKVAINSFRRK